MQRIAKNSNQGPIEASRQGYLNQVCSQHHYVTMCHLKATAYRQLLLDCIYLGLLLDPILFYILAICPRIGYEDGWMENYCKI